MKASPAVKFSMIIFSSLGLVLSTAAYGQTSAGTGIGGGIGPGSGAGTFGNPTTTTNSFGSAAGTTGAPGSTIPFPNSPGLSQPTDQAGIAGQSALPSLGQMDTSSGLGSVLGDPANRSTRTNSTPSGFNNDFEIPFGTGPNATSLDQQQAGQAGISIPSQADSTTGSGTNLNRDSGIDGFSTSGSNLDGTTTGLGILESSPTR